jgi:hypothetical protein
MSTSILFLIKYDDCFLKTKSKKNVEFDLQKKE